jgi:hypothetical protein
MHYDLRVASMAFAELFAECEAVNYLKSWPEVLPPETKEGLDDASSTTDSVATYLVRANLAAGGGVGSGPLVLGYCADQL